MKIIWEKLWPEVALHKKVILMAILFGIIVSSMKALSPELMRRLVSAWNEKDHSLAWQIPILISFTWIIAGVARYFHLFWMKFTSDKIAVKLRHDLMNKYLSLNLAFFQRFVSGSGGLISRMLNDIFVVQESIHRLADFFREPFLILFSLGYLVYIDWKLTLFLIVALPIVTNVLRLIARSLRKYSSLNQEAVEQLTKTLKESLDGTRVVQSFNLEEEMRRRFNKEADFYLKTRKKIVSREEAAGPISESLASITLALLMIYIGNQIFANQLAVEDFVGFTFAIGLLQDSVKKMQTSYIKLQQASVALERMHKVLDSDDIVPQKENPLPFPKDWQDIKFKNVSFAFDKDIVLNKINLTVKRGEVIALVGSSGGGKSTLVNLLERFFDPTEGEVLIGETAINDIGLADLRDHVALVSQDVFLFADTIERNIQAGNFDKDKKFVPEAAKVANAHDFISKTPHGYQTLLGDQGSRLSGGEKQRVSISRAIFKDAPILILDEATSALDSESEKEVQKGLDELLKGRTAFVIAHRLSTIKKADRILVMREGSIVEEGTHAELMAHQGEYFHFQQLQSTL